jgi:parallel beta-helix repeat protein
MKTIILFIALCLVSVNGLNVIVGLTDCPTCINYYKVIHEDSQPVLQKAAKDVYSSGGGTITIQAGTYILYKQVEFFSNTKIIGSGIDKTIFKLIDHAAPWKVGSSVKSGLFRTAYQTYNSCINISFIGFTLDGNKANQNTDPDSEYGRYGMFNEACTNILMDSVHIQNFQGYGFDPHGWKSSNMYGKNLTIKNCVSNDNNWDGFTLDQTDTITFTNNVATNNGRHGVNVVTGSFNVLISGVKTNHNGYYDPHNGTGCGVMVQNNMLFGTNNAIVEKSTLINDKKGGICTDDVYNIKMNTNTITNPEKCIVLKDSRQITITNNYCTSTKKVFISNVNSNTITESSNTLSWVNPITPDPTCALGVKSGKYCCLSSCGTCGGTGCGLRIGKSAGCCTSNILNSGKLCSTYSAPCLIA